MSTTQVPLIYFGKVPGRGDFVRSAANHGLIQTFDRWISSALEMISAEPRWKELYDGAVPLNFAVLGPQRSFVVAGHLRVSADASGRRFPFLVAGSFAVDEPDRFMARAPLALNRLWATAEHWSRRAQAPADATAVLAELGQQRIELDIAPTAYDAPAADFAGIQTVGSAQALLTQGGKEVDFARIVLGLGQLLQPVPASGSARLDTGLTLPLPSDLLYRPFMASWWMELVTSFVARADFEMLLLLPQTGDPASMSVGFAGGSAAALAAHLGRMAQPDAPYIELLNPEWADEAIQQDYALRKVGSYLQQHGLSLAQVQRTFGETFLGA